MLKNIIFDMGNVLIDYDPYYIIGCHGIKDPDDMKLLAENIFYSVGWKKMDLGTYDENDIYNDAIRKLPARLHPVVRELLDSWYESMTPVKGMKELIEKLKKRGYGIYLLSNAGKAKDIYWDSIPGSEYFDGTIVSAFEGCIKPDRKIYEILLDRYALKADECLFIDDVQENVDGATAVGISAHLFDGDVEALEKFIDEQIENMKERKTNMTFIEEEKLEKVNGGGISEIINTNDVINYIQVLSERPGIIDRLRENDLSDEDADSIYRHFPSENKFIMIARFAHDKTIEELMAIAAANDGR